MFGGLSAELLWKPQGTSRLALGAEINYVRPARRRTTSSAFRITPSRPAICRPTMNSVVDIRPSWILGRYLASDYGATLSLTREFDNGWRVGAFATVTDVSAADFGEGSFDKGIMLTIPLDWATGRLTATAPSSAPFQRDGGARLAVSGRLYDLVRSRASELDASWARFSAMKPWSCIAVVLMLAGCQQLQELTGKPRRRGP